MTSRAAPPPGSPGPVASDRGPADRRALLDRYWRRNLALMAVLLAIWAFVGLGCGVLLADRLNALDLRLGGFPLGFWFAQQGSIIGFVLLILAYALAMNRLDRLHRAEIQTRLRRTRRPAADRRT